MHFSSKMATSSNGTLRVPAWTAWALPMRPFGPSVPHVGAGRKVILSLCEQVSTGQMTFRPQHHPVYSILKF